MISINDFGGRGSQQVEHQNHCLVVTVDVAFYHRRQH